MTTSAPRNPGNFPAPHGPGRGGAAGGPPRYPPAGAPYGPGRGTPGGGPGAMAGRLGADRGRRMAQPAAGRRVGHCPATEPREREVAGLRLWCLMSADGVRAPQASSKMRTAMVPWVTAAPAPRPAATMIASAICAFVAPAFLALVTWTSMQ